MRDMKRAVRMMKKKGKRLDIVETYINHSRQKRRQRQKEGRKWVKSEYS